MPTLPTSSIDISAGVTFQQQPSRTWYINRETRRIQGEVDGLAAVRQAVEIILNVERFRWQIYRPYSGMQWEGLIGQDPGTARGGSAGPRGMWRPNCSAGSPRP